MSIARQEATSSREKKFFAKVRGIGFILLVILFFSVLIPLFLDIFIFGNGFPSYISNSDWSSFLGSYLGGIISGAGTLAAVYITTNETRKIQNESEERNRQEKLDKETKEVVQLLSTFLSNIHNFYLTLGRKAELENSFNQCEEEKSQIHMDMSKQGLSRKQVEALSNDLNTVQSKISNLKNQRELLLLKIDDIINSISKSYIILTSFLTNDLAAKEILNIATKMYDSVNKYCVNGGEEIDIISLLKAQETYILNDAILNYRTALTEDNSTRTIRKRDNENA